MKYCCRYQKKFVLSLTMRKSTLLFFHYPHSYICAMNILAKDRQYIWHPFTPQKNMAEPVAIERGKDTLLFDENGNSYVDAISSWWVTLHGHAHPYIAEKLYKQALQLEQVIFAGFTHKPAVELAERLIQRLPGAFSKIFYSDNGSTSTEVALKMAIQFWWNQEKEQDVDDNKQGSVKTKQKRNKILALKNSYHGDTFGAMSVSDRSVFTLAFHELLFEVIFIEAPQKDNLFESLDVLKEKGDEIAAFIYEPLVQGAGGMKMYDTTAMNTLLAAAKEQNIILIADEVMTGFGRTGKLFASEHLNYTPDIICLSKGLTGGTMALGVTACTQSIYNAYVTDDKLKTFFHGHSFTANPLACTAALASLDLLEQNNVPGKVQWLTNKNEGYRKKLQSDYSQACKNVRVLGTILAFELDHGSNEYLNNISTVITEMAMQKGVYIRPLGNTVYIMPPYCITEAELEKVYETIEQIINRLFS